MTHTMDARDRTTANSVPARWGPFDGEMYVTWAGPGSGLRWWQGAPDTDGAVAARAGGPSDCYPTLAQATIAARDWIAARLAA